MKNQYIVITVITLIFVSVAFPTLAQLAPSIPRVPSVFGDPPSLPAAPIDGGLSLLIAGGIGYGVKKMRDKKVRNSESEVESEK